MEQGLVQAFSGPTALSVAERPAAVRSGTTARSPGQVLLQDAGPEQRENADISFSAPQLPLDSLSCARRGLY